MCAEMVSASKEVGIGVLMDLCQRLLNGKGMPDEWRTIVVVLIFKEKAS